MHARLILFSLATLLFVGCVSQKTLLQKIVPKDDDAKARHFIELVRTSDLDAAGGMLTANIRNEKAAQALKLIHEMLSHGEPLGTTVESYNVTRFESFSKQTRKTDLSYEIQFKDRWVLCELVLEQSDSDSGIAGFHFYPLRDSLENLNRFTLIGKSLRHYAALALCILIPAFILFALIVCIRTPVRRKWLWIIFILFGLFQFRFDWSSARSDMKPVSIVLFGSGAFASGLGGPWVLDWALPVGAFVFLLRRRQLTIAKPSTAPPTI